MEASKHEEDSDEEKAQDTATAAVAEAEDDWAARIKKQRAAAKARRQREAAEAAAAAGAATPAKPEGDEIVYQHHDDAPKTDAVLSQVKSYFFEELAFSDMVTSWAALHLDAIDVDNTEMKLEYTALYEEFLAEFEERLSKVIESTGSSPAQFYQLLKAAQRTAPSGPDARFTQMMLAAIEFPSFVQLLKDLKREQLAANKAKK